MIASNIVFAVIAADQRLDGTGSVRPDRRVGKSVEGACGAVRRRPYEMIVLWSG
jgi:hypothetical protein